MALHLGTVCFICALFDIHMPIITIINTYIGIRLAFRLNIQYYEYKGVIYKNHKAVDYVLDHMCAYPACFEKPVKGSSYCEEHKCKNCDMRRSSGYGDFCYDCFKNTKTSHKTGLSFYGTAEVEYLKKETHLIKNKTNNIPHT